MTLFYTDTRPNSSRTVVLIHGFMADHHYWDMLIDQFPKTTRIIAVDLLGFGQSPKPKKTDAYSLDNQVLMIRKTLEALVGVPFTLVGHSMGALIAARYAALYPEEVRHVILSNMPLFIDAEVTKKELKSTSKLYRELMYRPSGRLAWPMIKKYQNKFKEQFPEIHYMSSQHTHASRQGSLRTIEHVDGLSLLTHLPVPADLIIGSYDRISYEENLAKIATPQHITVHRVNTGHHTPQRSPDVLLDLLAKYELV